MEDGIGGDIIRGKDLCGSVEMRNKRGTDYEKNIIVNYLLVVEDLIDRIKNNAQNISIGTKNEISAQG